MIHMHKSNTNFCNGYTSTSVIHLALSTPGRPSPRWARPRCSLFWKVSNTNFCNETATTRYASVNVQRQHTLPPTTPYPRLSSTERRLDSASKWLPSSTRRGAPAFRRRGRRASPRRGAPSPGGEHGTLGPADNPWELTVEGRRRRRRRRPSPIWWCSPPWPRQPRKRAGRPLPCRRSWIPVGGAISGRLCVIVFICHSRMGPLGGGLQLMWLSRAAGSPTRSTTSSRRQRALRLGAVRRNRRLRLDAAVATPHGHTGAAPRVPRGARARVGLKAFAQDDEGWTLTTTPPSPASACHARGALFLFGQTNIVTQPEQPPTHTYLYLP